MDKIIIYTDGSSIGNGSVDSKCGWAVKMMYNGYVKTKSGADVGKTNNQMEIIAALNGLKSVTDKTIPCEIISDSQHVVKIMNKEWQYSTNHELWQQIFAEVDKFKDLSISWVKAHGENMHNNEVDALAYQTALKGV